jgi:hypothetical protein
MLSTVLLAWMIAWRKGCTPNETLVMSAIPASTATGRSQPTVTGRAARAAPADAAGCGLRSPLGWGRRCSRGSGNRSSPGSRGDEMPVGAGSGAGQAQLQCQAQCPFQTQCLARPTASAAKLTSHGRGGRVPILARIRSSPSVPGSIGLTASVSARRSASSMPSSGAVMPSPARLRRSRHDVSRVRIVLSDAIARAVWLFTAPLLIPIAWAMSASEKSA